MVINGVEIFISNYMRNRIRLLLIVTIGISSVTTLSNFVLAGQVNKTAQGESIVRYRGDAASFDISNAVAQPYKYTGKVRLNGVPIKVSYDVKNVGSQLQSADFAYVHFINNNEMIVALDINAFRDDLQPERSYLKMIEPGQTHRVNEVYVVPKGTKLTKLTVGGANRTNDKIWLLKVRQSSELSHN
jgi:hypothetical protein